MSKELIERIDEWFERHPLPLEFADKQLYLDCRDELTKQADYIAGLRQTIRSFELKLGQQAERVKALEGWLETMQTSINPYDRARAESLAALLKEGEE